MAVPLIQHKAAARPAPGVKAPGSKEIATLNVKGERHENWKSVRVETKVEEWFPTFMFETTEFTPIPLKVAENQFQPGDEVTVDIGGIQVCFGYITERHVAIDGKQHAIRLVGNGDTYDVPTSSVPPDVYEANHDGKNWPQLARDLMKHLNIKLGVVGNVDTTPFQKIGIQPGETLSMVMERYARMRNIVIGSDPNGGLLGIGENEPTPSGELVEGTHILKANAVIRDGHKYGRIFAVAQDTGGSSGTGGAAANQQKVELAGTHTRNRHMVAVCEVADKPHGVQRRCHMERVFTEGTEIEANITVQGWFKDNNNSDQIWKSGEYYFINSPSLMLPGAILGCAQCVYEQSDSGTTTTLHMVDPPHMNGLYNYRVATQMWRLGQLGGATAVGRAPRSVTE
jgi:prophage tail gpP-like protein